jgi:leucyl aminopeptidase
MAEQKPDAMIDLATLTGGMMVALGRKTTGFFANRDDLADEILAAGRRTGEQLWRMPLLDHLRKEIDSDVADIKNTGGRYGSPIFGALFLRDFVGDTPWAHFDIAGPARSDKDDHYVSKGATGVGTRLVIDWVEHRAN